MPGGTSLATLRKKLGNTVFLFRVPVSSFEAVHSDQLKLHYEEGLAGDAIPLFYPPQTLVPSYLKDPPVDHVSDHQISESGEREFLIHREGMENQDESWVPETVLLEVLPEVWLAYCQTWV